MFLASRLVNISIKILSDLPPAALLVTDTGTSKAVTKSNHSRIYIIHGIFMFKLPEAVNHKLAVRYSLAFNMIVLMEKSSLDMTYAM